MSKKPPSPVFVGRVFSGDGQTRITKGADYVVGGGTAEHHEKAVALTEEVSRQFRRDQPETPSEVRMILRDAAKKVGVSR
jgi:hypothetical protein